MEKTTLKLKKSTHKQTFKDKNSTFSLFASLTLLIGENLKMNPLLQIAQNFPLNINRVFVCPCLGKIIRKFLIVEKAVSNLNAGLRLLFFFVFHRSGKQTFLPILNADIRAIDTENRERKRVRGIIGNKIVLNQIVDRTDCPIIIIGKYQFNLVSELLVPVFPDNLCLIAAPVAVTRGKDLGLIAIRF